MGLVEEVLVAPVVLVDRVDLAAQGLCHPWVPRRLRPKVVIEIWNGHVGLGRLNCLVSKKSPKLLNPVILVPMLLN